MAKGKKKQVAADQSVDTNYDDILNSMFDGVGEPQEQAPEKTLEQTSNDEMNIVPEGMEEDIMGKEAEPESEPEAPVPESEPEPVKESEPEIEPVKEPEPEKKSEPEPVKKEEPKKEEPKVEKTPEELKKEGDEILAQLERELMEMNNKGKVQQEEVKKAEEALIEAQKDNNISKEEYNKMVDEYNKILNEKEMLSTDMSRLTNLVKGYKEKLDEQAEVVNKYELDSVINSPINNVINKDNNLKKFALLMNKSVSTGKKEFEDQAVDSIYSWLENKTGLNIKELIKQELDAKKEALSGDDSSGGVKVSRQAKTPKGVDEAGDLVDSAMNAAF